LETTSACPTCPTCRHGSVTGTNTSYLYVYMFYLMVWK
jgi:hypothetical protein